MIVEDDRYWTDKDEKTIQDDKGPVTLKLNLNTNDIVFRLNKTGYQHADQQDKDNKDGGGYDSVAIGWMKITRL